MLFHIPTAIPSHTSIPLTPDAVLPITLISSSLNLINLPFEEAINISLPSVF